MAAVQLADPALADRASLLAREHGVITRVLLGGALQVSPPLVITRAELDEIAAGFAAALDACPAASPAARLTRPNAPLSGGQLPANEARL